MVVPTKSLRQLATCLILFLLFLVSGLAQTQPSASTALQRGAAYLSGLQRSDGAICDPTNPLFDTWETILAAEALYAFSPDTTDPVLQKALAYLRSQRNEAGLLCHNRRCQGSYCLETTAEYLILLHTIGARSHFLREMAHIVALQLPSGAWEIGNPAVREQKAFPSVTAFVLAIPDSGALPPDNRQKAIRWLLQQQKSDKQGLSESHWGSAWEYYGCTAYALWPVMRALSPVPGIDATRLQVVSTFGYSQQENGSWSDAGGEKMPSVPLQTALMLNALSYLPDSLTVAMRAAGVAFLQQQQSPDGHWDGGLFPIPGDTYQKREDVAATAWAVLALARNPLSPPATK